MTSAELCTDKEEWASHAAEIGPEALRRKRLAHGASRLWSCRWLEVAPLDLTLSLYPVNRCILIRPSLFFTSSAVVTTTSFFTSLFHLESRAAWSPLLDSIRSLHVITSHQGTTFRPGRISCDFRANSLVHPYGAPIYEQASIGHLCSKQLLTYTAPKT